MFKLGRYPLRLRFAEGDEIPGGAEAPETAAPEADTGINPAWDPIRSELDELTFHRIAPHLKAMDQSANQRITASNQALAPYKEFIDSGVTPDAIQTGLQLANRLNTDEGSLEFYNALGTYLRDNGRLPNEAELEQEVADNAAEAGEEQAPVSDPRYDQLAQQQQAMQNFLADQEHTRLVGQADAELTVEQNALKAAHPELSDADMKDILRQAASTAQLTGKIPSLAEVHDGWYTELKSRFLSAPRPGDSAPNLLPTSGGTAASVPQKALGELSRQEVQDVIASLVSQQK